MRSPHGLTFALLAATTHAAVLTVKTCTVYSGGTSASVGIYMLDAGPSVFDLSVSGRPPTSSEAAGPLEKKQNKHCFLAVTPPLSTWWVDQARRRRKFYGGTTLKISFSILLADQPLRRDISDGSFSGFWF